MNENEARPGPYTSGDVARLLGVSLDTLRRWEREGAITPATRSHAGHRRYWASDVDRIAAFRAGRKADTK